jgi:hypothetical protein
LRFHTVNMLLLGAALGCSEPELPPAVGAWQVSVVNGATMPAPTATGKPLRYGLLRLMNDQNGSLEYCTGLPEKGRNYFLRWRFLSETRLQFTYFSTTGGELPIDTVTVAGQTMNYRAKVAEADLGASNWRLVLIAVDPSEPLLDCA